jgi:hypothetical protein
VAHGARRYGKIPAQRPGHRVEFKFIRFGFKDIAVLTHLVNLKGGNIGTFVALGTGVRLAGRFNGKGVPGMAGAAGSQAAVRIDASLRPD